MAQIGKAIEIDAPIALVFALLQPARLGEWYGLETHTRFSLTGEGDFGLGSRLDIRSDLGRHSAQVVEFSAPAKLSWQTDDGSTRVALLLFPVENTTSVQLIEDYRLKGPLGALVDRLFVRKRSAQAAARNLANLKRLAEWETYQQRQKLQGNIPLMGSSPIRLFDPDG